VKSRMSYGQVKKSGCWIMLLSPARLVFITSAALALNLASSRVAEWASGILN